MRTRAWMAPALVLLGSGIAAVAILGPAGLGVLEHRTSQTTVNQLIGADVAGLAVVAPFAIVVAVLAWRRHPAAPALALAPGVYAAYTFTQYTLGQEFLDLPGNVERFFPLLLAVFMLGAAVAIGAWTAIDADRLPALSRGFERVAAGALLLVAVFLLVGLHLPMLPDVLSDTPTRVEYVSSPTAFWLVKFMDLGILVPAAVAVAVGLLNARPWARKAAYGVLGGFTLIGVSVASMATVMLARSDPDASAALVAAFTGFAAVYVALAVALYRPLFAARTDDGPPTSEAATTPDRVAHVRGR
jgi:hypothetical protein